MKKTMFFCIAFFGIAFGVIGSTIASQENTGVSFYLVKNNIDPEDIYEFDIGKVILDESPIFTSKDIIEYSQGEHSIKLTEEAYKRYKALRWLTVFALCVDDKPVYLGHIGSKYRTAHINGIIADPGIDGRNEILLRYQIGVYIDSDENNEESIDDPRQNKLILDSLRRSNKLLETTPEQKALKTAKKSSIRTFLARKPLTPEQQTAFLAKRTPGSMTGSFGSYSSLLFAIKNVVIHSNNNQINNTPLSSPFPQFYKPTWKEVFDSIARQTKSTWKYNPKSDNWIFSKPAMPVPFEVKIAKKWISEDRGLYVYYKPPYAPVGMDIYMMGTYSSTDKEKVQEGIALSFARHFNKDVTVKDMTTVKVGKYDALHFKIKAPQTGVIMRQWTIVESGKAFAIINAVKPRLERKILRDVEKMLKSFTIKTEKIDLKNRALRLTRCEL